MTDRLWIAWTRQRRSTELAPEFGARLYQFGWHKIRPLRYPVALAATLAVLLRRRPRLVFVQNPSILCAALMVCLKKIFGIRVVVDTHTLVVPLEGMKRRAFDALTRFIERGADLTIVTNRHLAAQIEGRGGRAAVLPDKVPCLPRKGTTALAGRKNVVYICSFAADEPYREVLRAARALPPDVHVWITGNGRRVADPALRSLPGNVHLTGFLPECDYVDLLHAADAILALTRVPHCMLCAAYEAVAAGKPLVLSDHAVLREYFTDGVVHVRNNAEEIEQAIRRILADEEGFRNGMARLRERLQQEWPLRRQRVANLLTRTGA